MFGHGTLDLMQGSRSARASRRCCVFPELTNAQLGGQPALDGGGPEGLLARARALSARADYSSAAEDFKAYTLLNPTDSEGQLGYATALAKLGLLETAIAACTVVLEANAGNTQAAFTRAVCHNRQGDYLEAFADYALALENDHICFRAQRDQRRAKRSSRPLTPPLVVEFPLPPVHALSEFPTLQQQSLEDAAGLRSSIGEDVSDSEMHLRRGLLHEKEEEFAEAETAFTEAILLDSSHSASFFARGSLYDRLQRWAEAIADFSEAIRLEPTNAALYHARGFTHRNAGNYDEAVVDYTKSLELDPTNPVVYTNRGFAERKLDLYHLAVQDYSTALAMEPTNVRTLNNRGYCLARLGQYDLAIEDYSLVIKIDSANVHAYHNRGISHDKNQAHELAIADFTKLLELEPQNANAHFNRGSAYDALGDLQAAVEDFNAALRLDQRRPQTADFSAVDT